MVASSQTTISHAFSLMKVYEFRLTFHLNLFLRVKGTAHIKQHSYQMTIFSSGIKIFKIAFQHVVYNSCMVPIAPSSATNFSHMTLFRGKTPFFTILDSTPKRDVRFSFFVFENGLDICDPQTRSFVFRYMVQFSTYDVFHKKNDISGVDLLFFITLGNYINWILTSKMTV